jgi:Predicted metal-dependent phosphoesterases (PHP family)
MTEGLVDLHIHSNFSCDGDFSPEELVRMAREQKFRAMAIADHDTVEAYPQAIQIGKEWGIEIIPSIEVTTIFDSREFHLLLPFVDWESEAIHYIISKMESSRLEEAQARVQRLKEKGIEITWEEVEEKCGGIPPLGVKIAQIVLDKLRVEKIRFLPDIMKREDRLSHPISFTRIIFPKEVWLMFPKNTSGWKKC